MQSPDVSTILLKQMPIREKSLAIIQQKENMKKDFLLIFVILLKKSWQIEFPNSPASDPNPGTLTPDQFERLFGDGEIYNAEHEEVSDGHISSSMEDLLKLCEYEKSVQDEVSQLPNSKIKSDYYQNLKADVIFLLSI